MIRIGFALLALLTGIQLAHAQTVTVQRADILDYGIYAVDQQPTGRNADGVLQSEVRDIKLAVKTQAVNAVLGTHFGFEYTIVGAPEGAKVSLRSIVIYPPGGIHPPGKAPVPQYAVNVNRVIGGQSYLHWYAFDDPWELVPGTWTFQLWYGDHKIAEQSFLVVLP